MKKLTFITTFGDLKVVINAPRRLTDPLSGAPGMIIPAHYAKFRGFEFSTEDEYEQRVLVEKYYTAKSRGYNVTYSPKGKSDEEMAASIWSSIQNGSIASERVIDNKDTQIALLSAELEKYKKLAEHNGNAPRLTKSKKKVALFSDSPEKDESAPLNQAGQILSDDDTESEAAT